MKETHLIIIWAAARSKEKMIIDDIMTSKLIILSINEIYWSRGKFSENLSRFYGQNLKDIGYKVHHCGDGGFKCIVVDDLNPKYCIRNTSSGKQVVNINLFDRKKVYRKWTGGGHRVHATDNKYEAIMQLSMIYAGTHSYFKNEKLEGDITGSNGWKSIYDALSSLNDVCNYIVLRNFENIEDTLNSKHPDVDMLVDNQDLVVRMLNAKKTSSISYRAQYIVNIDGKKVNFDIRYIGDDYYHSNWAFNMLSCRVKKHGFYIPDHENYFYSLLYHCLIHKDNVSKDYLGKITELQKQLYSSESVLFNDKIKQLEYLEEFLHEKKYIITEPKDLTVYFNIHLLNKTADRFKISIKRDLRMKFYSLFRKVYRIFK